tara:strand:- start:2945 stop:3187 length:243 start_codon:yes stop_codon:yes gene_type:complete
MTQLFVGRGRISVIHTPNHQFRIPQFGTPPVNTLKIKYTGQKNPNKTIIGNVGEEINLSSGNILLVSGAFQAIEEYGMTE